MAVPGIADLQTRIGSQALSRPHPSEHVETLDDNIEIDRETEIIRALRVSAARLQFKLREYVRLDKGVGLHTLGILNSHFDPICRYEPSRLFPDNTNSKDLFTLNVAVQKCIYCLPEVDRFEKL